MARTLRIDALALEDPFGLVHSPASVLLELREETQLPFLVHARAVPHADATVLAVGRPSLVSLHPAAGHADRVSLPGHVLLPGLVNAHTHLDLTHIGPRSLPPGGGFPAFARLVMQERRSDDALIADSVRSGIRLQLEGGVVAVGDIAGAAAGHPRAAAWRTLRDSPLGGVSFLEFFSIGARAAVGLERLGALLASLSDEEMRGAGLGLSPHAPYSVEPDSYRASLAIARRLGLRLSTHLAESPGERSLIEGSAGPLREMLEQLGSWEARLSDVFGSGRSPVQHLAGVLGEAGPSMSAVHLNDVSTEDLDLLASTRTPVIYCPRASRYFGAAAAFGPHRWREMLSRGIPLSLGTDSIINLPAGTDRVGGGGFSTLAEMRVLWAELGSVPPGTHAGNPGPGPLDLLRMATTTPAEILGLDPARWSLAPDSRPAGLVAVNVEGIGAGSSPGSPTRAVLESCSPAELLLVGKTPEPRR